MLTVSLVLWSATARSVAFGGSPGSGVVPDFAVRTTEGSFQEYRHRDVVADGYVKARVRAQEGDIWLLTVTAKVALREVCFPGQFASTVPEGKDEEQVIYYPYRMGVVERVSAIPPDEWRSQSYPGGAFAPLIVAADSMTATMVAAVNWPPRVVRPEYTRGRMRLCYEGPTIPGERRTYAVMLTVARANERTGVYPWHLVLDHYKAWLTERMKGAGLYPIRYPEPLRSVHGWLHVGLQQLARFRIGDVDRLYEARRQVFPWIQFWGQMSNYQREPREGLSDWPDPPLGPFEQVGCCLDRPVMHPRYRDTLPEFARRVIDRGGMVGYYTRPRSPYASIDNADNPDFAFLRQWTETNRQDGANAFYLDVLGARTFGPPLAVARLLSSVLPEMSVIEWPVDVYPSAFLVGGSLWGGPQWRTVPGQELDASHTRMTFPRFGRYLLDDRIIFLGCSNGDFMWWGPYRGWDHWTERQVFLLGAKFDAPTRFKGQAGWIDPLNPVVKRIVAEREQAMWWERAPRYRDRAGISELPKGVDVRHFVDRDGVDLFVVDNPLRRRGTSFSFGRRRVAVPQRALSIVVAAANSH